MSQMNSSYDPTEAGIPYRACHIRSACASTLGQKPGHPDSWQLTRRSQHLEKDLWEIIKSSIRKIVPMTSSARMDAAVAKEHRV